MDAYLCNCNDTDTIIFEKTVTSSFTSAVVDKQTTREGQIETLTIVHDREFSDHVRLMSTASVEQKSSITSSSFQSYASGITRFGTTL